VLQEGEQRTTPLPFLQKPFTLEALQGAVRQAMEGAVTPAR
jgi:FixJ family two-component response regulator